MRFAAFTVVVALAVANPVFPQTTPKTTRDIILFSSSDSASSVSAERLNSCFHQLAHEWKVNEKSLPQVIVFQASKRAAHTALVNKKVEVRHNRSADHTDDYYEVWLVESTSNEDFVLALSNVIEDHFQLKPTDDERRQILARMSRVQNATISALEGR